MLPDRWAVELAARLELRAVDWAHTRAFMLPNDDMGYVRLNLRGRERDGIVEPEKAEALLREIATGLQTFCDPDGKPAIRKVDRVRELGVDGSRFDQLPDLIVHWREQTPKPLAGVSSPQYGDVPSPGWGTGRTGRHTDEAWALVVPGASRLKAPTKPPHIVDIVATVCTVLGVDAAGLAGQPLLDKL